MHFPLEARGAAASEAVLALGGQGLGLGLGGQGLGGQGLGVGGLGRDVARRFARVTATFRRRKSERKPTSRRGLDRTSERRTTSFSWPWKLSTVATRSPVTGPVDCASLSRLRST